MNRLLLGSAVVLALNAAALGADMRVPVRKAPPPPVVLFSWTGCYIGAHAGGAWSRADYVTVMEEGDHLGRPENVAAVSAAGITRLAASSGALKQTLAVFRQARPFCAPED